MCIGVVYCAESVLPCSYGVAKGGRCEFLRCVGADSGRPVWIGARVNYIDAKLTPPRYHARARICTFRAGLLDIAECRLSGPTLIGYVGCRPGGSCWRAWRARPPRLIDSSCVIAVIAVRRLRDEREKLIIPALQRVHGELGLQGRTAVLAHVGGARCSRRMVYTLFRAVSAACAVAVPVPVRPDGKGWERAIPLIQRRLRFRLRALPCCCLCTLLLRRLTDPRGKRRLSLTSAALDPRTRREYRLAPARRA